MRALTSSIEGTYLASAGGSVAGGVNASPVTAANLIRSTLNTRRSLARRQCPIRYQLPNDEKTDHGSTSRSVVSSRLSDVYVIATTSLVVAALFSRPTNSGS